MNIDDNIRLADDGRSTECVHCSERLGDVQGDPLANALRREQPSTAAGPGIRFDPHHFTDREIVLRQAFCPKCHALLATEVVPADEPGMRFWKLG